jgi:hypothetical protein
MQDWRQNVTCRPALIPNSCMHLSCIRATCLFRCILHLIFHIIFDEEYKLWSPRYVFFSILLHFIPLRSTYSALKYPQSVFLSLMWETTFHTLQSASRIMMLYNLNFTFLDSRLEDKKFWTELQQAFREFKVLLIFSRMQFLFVTVFPSIWTVPYFRSIC